MNPGDIATKVDFIRVNFETLDRIPHSSIEEFCSDFRNLDSALYRLQTAIQGLLDLGCHLCASLALPTPSASRDVLQALEDAGHLPPGSVTRFGPMFGFRNRVVHLYDRIDPQIVFQILVERRQDLRDLLDLLLAVLERSS